MTPQQSAHITKLQTITAKRISSKYRAGAEEHGGNIWDIKPEALLESAIDEAIDQVVYLLTLRDSMAGLAEKAWMYDSLAE